MTGKPVQLAPARPEFDDVALLISYRDLGIPVPRAVLTRVAQTLATMPPVPVADGCEGCGVALVQKPTGRPRKWCSEACRRSGGNPRKPYLGEEERRHR